MVRVEVTEDVGLADADVDELWEPYAAVWPETDAASWRTEVWERHSGRAGFRLVRAYDGPRLVGFGYGYTGAHGQWWTDHVARTLPPEVAARWLGGHFEVVSIGVRADARGAGLGASLLTALCAVPHERLLLMTTADATDPARRLYARQGWSVLGPGVGESTVVMGRRTGQDAR